MRIVLVIVLAVMLGMAVANHQYVSAYDTAVGQLMLAVVALVFFGGLMWLRRLAMPEKINRFLVDARLPLGAESGSE